MKYDILKDEAHREGLIEAADKISRFIKENNVQTIVALDKSGRPAGLLVSEMYKKLFPNETQPQVYFLNLPNDIYSEKGNLRLTNPALAKRVTKNRDHPILVLDEYALSEENITHAEEILRRLGAGTIYKGAYTKGNVVGKKSWLDVVGIENLELKKFFHDFGWTKNTGIKEIDEKSSPDYENRDKARNLRRELKQLVQNYNPKQSESLKQPDTFMARIKKGLERVVAGILIITGLGFLIYQDYFITGNVISSVSLADSDLGFFSAIIMIALGGILLHISLGTKQI